MKPSTAILFLIASLALIVSCIVAGTTAGVLGFALYPLPDPKVQMVYITSAPEFRVVTATPDPIQPTAIATQAPLMLVVTATLQPTMTPPPVMEFQPGLATAYPIQPTPAAALPPVRMSGGIPIKGYGYAWSTDLDKGDLPYRIGNTYCVGGT